MYFFGVFYIFDIIFLLKLYIFVNQTVQVTKQFYFKNYTILDDFC